MVKDFHHYKGNDLNRAEKIQRDLSRILVKNKVGDSKRDSSAIWELMHVSGCSQIGRMLAQRRGLDAELAEIACMLHDVSVIVSGKYTEHAKRGAEIARKMLLKTGDFKTKEIDLITDAIASHSEKEKISPNPIAELVKDADTFDCSLYNNSEGYYVLHKPPKIFKTYKARVRKVRKELGLPKEPLFR